MAIQSPPPQSGFRRMLASVVKAEPDEIPAVLAGFFLFFFVLGSYFAVRPVRETVATVLGREYVADLWLYTALFSIAIVPVFGWLVARFRRSILMPCIYGSVAVILVIIAQFLKLDQGSEVSAEALRADPTYLAAGSFFYVWISVLNLMLISVFWSFLLEMFSSEQARRLFGFVAAGGTAGALAGPIATRLAVDSLGNAGIMYIGTVGFLLAIVCQRFLISIWRRPQSNTSPAPADRGLGGNPFAGIGIVARSPYLWGIALFVVLLSAANTFLYFEQLRIVEEVFPDRTRRTEVFANIDIAVQSLTIITQFFLTGRIAATFGVRALLTIVPIVMVVGFTVLSFAAAFPVLATVFILRRWGEYALVRPGREMLWSKLDTESKYKAKNFVDVPVYRAADYVGAQAKTALDAAGSGPSGAMIVAAVLAAMWAVNGWLLGRKHDDLPRERVRTAEAAAE
jgi:AAA family ATP:ADP antiporter